MAFCDLEGNIEVATEFIKYLLKYVLENCQEDMNLFNSFIDKTIIDTLEKIVSQDFKILSYTEAIDILTSSGENFEFPVKWGSDLQAEHERYLCEKSFKKPVVLIDYPREIKAFYMKINDDNKTVRAMDILFPQDR